MSDMTTPMLSCEELHRLKLTEPNRVTAEMERHLAKCPPCAEFASSVDRVERRLEEAANVPVPDSLVARALRAGDGVSQPRRKPRVRWPDLFGFRLSFPALAAVAAVLAVFAVSAVLWTQVRESQRLALDVIAMVRTDNAVTPPSSPGARDAAQRLLASYGIRLASGVSEARYVGPCQVRGIEGAYIALFTVHGEARLILLPALDVRRRATSSAAGLTATVVPGAKGTAAVVATSSGTVEAVARLLL